MRHKTLAALTLAMLMSWGSTASAQETKPLWNTDSAFTAPAGRLELGLFSPTRYALSDKVELQTNLLLNAALPNLSAQVQWGSAAGWTFGTRHSLRYTTMLFNRLATEGTGGFLPANISPPQMLELDNDVRASRYLNPDHLLTLDLGVSYIPHFTDGVTPSGSLPVVDFPFLYPRLAAASGGATMRAGVAWSGRLVSSLRAAADLDVFYNPAVFLAPVVEQGAELAWDFSEHVSLSAGWRLTVAKYGYGTRLHVLPTLDVRAGF